MRYVGIDPSTMTGFVALDEQGNVLQAMELTAAGKDPERMYKLLIKITNQIKDQDIVAVEGFGFASQKAIVLGGIGWGARLDLFHRKIGYVEVAPMALKKFAGATGNKGPDGKAIKADKIEVAKQVLKRWGFESGSDNITDAYVLAQIARSLHEDMKLTAFQSEVLAAIRNGPVKKQKKAKVV